MYKKVIGLVLVGMMSLSVVGCGNKVVNETVEPQTEDIIIEVKEESNFDKYNILTFGTTDIDDGIKYSGDTYVDFKTRVTNESDKMINTVTVDFAYYDENGVQLGTTHPQIGDSIPGGVGFYVDSLYDSEEYPNLKGIKVIGYSYYDSEGMYYTVDLVGQVANVWE